MKKVFKVFFVLLFIIILAVAGVILFVKTALPRVGAPMNLSIELTPERIARGKYLANYVACCMDCHSKRDWNIFAGPYKKGSFGGGGEKFGRDIGFPGNLYSRNITPYALEKWTDGELFRAITTGESKDGKALFPLMAYHNFGMSDPEDIQSIIAYLRTLPAVNNEVPDRELDFPLNILVNTMPSKAVPAKRPESSNTVAYGEYLVNMADCIECHSKVDKGARVAGTEYGGGREFQLSSGGVAISANITPDRETGIGNWDQNLFIRKFTQFADSTYVPKAVAPGEFNTPMPWLMYSRMKESDLAAIYAYLKTIQPIRNKVDYFRP
ncbi:MAG: c-type cytochrome [Puia sp.]|nr:c-type cytochrome [Puia sp.]